MTCIDAYILLVCGFFLEQLMYGAESLLGKYISYLISHVSDTIAYASLVGNHSNRTYTRVVAIILEDISGLYKVCAFHFRNFVLRFAIC